MHEQDLVRVPGFQVGFPGTGEGPPDGVVVRFEGADLLAGAGRGVPGIVLDSETIALEGGEGIRALCITPTALEDPVCSGNREQMSEFGGRGLMAELPGGNPEQFVAVKHAEGGGFHLAAVAQRVKHCPATSKMPVDFFRSQVVVPLELRGGEDLISAQRFRGLPESNGKGMA